MSDKALIIGIGLAVYLYSRRNQAYQVTTTPRPAPMPASMPSSSGSGWQQMASGALVGLLRGIAAGPVNNTSTTIIPRNVDYIDRGGIAQEAVQDMPATIDDYIGGSGILESAGWA